MRSIDDLTRENAKMQKRGQDRARASYCGIGYARRHTVFGSGDPSHDVMRGPFFRLTHNVKDTYNRSMKQKNIF